MTESGRRAAGFVLAGGQSSRMGQDKALLTLRGEPLIARALKILQDAGLSAMIAGARSPLSDFASEIDDASLDGVPEGELGPLKGICAALVATPVEFAVFLPVDMPMVPASLIAFMVEDLIQKNAAVSLCSVGGFTQTFPTVISRRTLPFLRERLGRAELGCYSAFNAAAVALKEEVSVIPVEDLVRVAGLSHSAGLPISYWLMNVNTPEELAVAESVLAGTLPGSDRFRVS